MAQTPKAGSSCEKGSISKDLSPEGFCRGGGREGAVVRYHGMHGDDACGRGLAEFYKRERYTMLCKHKCAADATPPPGESPKVLL